MSTEAIGSNLPYISWAVGHLKDFQAIAVQVETIADATVPVEQKWAAFKTIITIGESIWSDFPTPSPAPAASHCTVEELVSAGVLTEEQLKANGAIINAILSNLPALIAAIASQNVIALITLLVSIFKPAPSPAGHVVSPV